MAEEIIYLTAEQVERLHRHRIMARDPHCREGVDWKKLEGALYRPQAGMFGQDRFPTLHEKAAALLMALVEAHAFYFCGNKRIAVIATSTFYKLNGYRMQAEQNELEKLTKDVATHRVEHEAVVERLMGWTSPMDLPDIDDDW